MMVINGILMPSDRFGAAGALMKHVVTFVLNSSKTLEFISVMIYNRNEKDIHNQN